jgi:Flp pilus assembly pilin Flp
MIREMMNRVLAVLRNEEGIETLEWIAMAFVIIVLVVIVAYPAGLPAAIGTVVGNITAAL